MRKQSIRYYDTSAFLPLLIQQTQSERALAVLEEDGQQLALSKLTLIELDAALRGLILRQTITLADARDALDVSQHIVIAQACTVLPISDAVLDNTRQIFSIRHVGNLTEVIASKGADALHVGIAHHARLGLVTGDKQQHLAALQLGLESILL